jgi:tetratricopeptide (TPR) repeat protein
VAATALFAVAAAAGEAVAHPPIFTDADSEQRAEELRKKGNALSREGRLADAIEAYRSSFKISETYAVAANLGSVELKLGRYRDAADHLAFAIRMSPHDAKRAVTEALENALASAKKHVGALKIRVSVDNAEVTIDGAPIDWLDLASEVYLEPGVHTIAATRAGYAADRRTVEARAGALLDVALAPAPPLAASSPPAEPAPLAHAPPAEGEGGGARVPLLIAGAGTATVGTALGVVFTVLANGKSSQAHVLGNELRARAGDAACSPPMVNAADCSNLKKTLTSQSVYANTAAWLFIASGAVALGTGAYALWPVLRGKSSTGASVRALPAAGVRSGGMVVTGEF